MRVAANLSFMFTEVPLLQRYKLAAAAGFKLVEVPFPYSEKAEELQNEANNCGLEHVLINAPVGDWASGFRGLAALPIHENEFLKGIDNAIHYATTLNCSRVHVMAGVVPPEQHQQCFDHYKQMIRMAAGKLEKADITCLIEPINRFSIPHYFLNSYELADEVIKSVGLPNLKLQFDVFHAQSICGQLTATVARYKDLIDYIQVAQVPSRHEPSFEGEINYEYFFKYLNDTNSSWTVGCEYQPSDADDRSWVERYGLQF